MEGAPAERRVRDRQTPAQRPTEGRRSQQLGPNRGDDDPRDAEGGRDHRLLGHRGHTRRRESRSPGKQRVVGPAEQLAQKAKERRARQQEQERSRAECSTHCEFGYLHFFFQLSKCYVLISRKKLFKQLCKIQNYFVDKLSVTEKLWWSLVQPHHAMLNLLMLDILYTNGIFMFFVFTISLIFNILYWKHIFTSYWICWILQPSAPKADIMTSNSDSDNAFKPSPNIGGYTFNSKASRGHSFISKKVIKPEICTPCGKR